jgi:hypothetical protein
MTPCRSIDFHAGCVLQPIPVPFGNLTDAEQDAIASQLIGNEMRAIPERVEYNRRVEAFEKAEKAAERAAQTPAQEEAREVEGRKVFPSTSYPRIRVESARPLRVTWLSFSEEAVPRVQRGTPHEVAVVQELAKKMGYAVTVDAKLRQKPFSNGALCLGCSAGPWYRGRYGEMRTFGHSFILSTPWLSRRPRTTAADAARALATLRAVRPRDPSSRRIPRGSWCSGRTTGAPGSRGRSRTWRASCASIPAPLAGTPSTRAPSFTPSTWKISRSSPRSPRPSITPRSKRRRPTPRPGRRQRRPMIPRVAPFASSAPWRVRVTPTSRGRASPRCFVALRRTARPGCDRRTRGELAVAFCVVKSVV